MESAEAAGARTSHQRNGQERGDMTGEQRRPGETDAPLVPPAGLMWAGLGATVVALAWRFALGGGAGLRVLLLVIGLSLVGAALWQLLPRLKGDQEGR